MKDLLKDIGKKKLIIIAGAIVGFIFLLIIALLIFHAVNNRKTGYKDIENKLLSAAKDYYSENENLLPQSESEQITIDDVSLTAAGYLKSMSELTSDMEGVSCSATVVVSYGNGNYRYTPLLDCGDSYKSITLSSYISDTNKVERQIDGSKESGLYDLNGELVYRGENPNNYVEFSGRMYRIVKVTADERVVLILDEKNESSVWDDRFNDERSYNDGINDYQVSRLKEVLDELYNDTWLVKDSDKGLLSAHRVYTGKRHESDNDNSGSIETSSYIDNQYVSVLPLYDYLNASVDENCESAETDSCMNYNYLNQYDYNWWTSTADAETTFRVYRAASGGSVDKITASSNGHVRPVIYLVSDALYVDGDGTKDNPFTIK